MKGRNTGTMCFESEINARVEHLQTGGDALVIAGESQPRPICEKQHVFGWPKTYFSGTSCPDTCVSQNMLFRNFLSRYVCLGGKHAFHCAAKMLFNAIASSKKVGFLNGILIVSFHTRVVLVTGHGSERSCRHPGRVASI